MKTKIVLFLMFFVSLSVMGQSDNTQGTITRKKCATCGKPLSQCKGHNKTDPNPKPEKTCSTCGKFLSMCQYKGKHPAPEAAGYDVTFSCNVSSASLYIDGTANGTASGTRFLKTGSHSIRVTASGYEDYSRSITVNRQHTSCSITLNRKHEPAKPVATATNTINGHEWVDLGLSVKWATCNVGASSPSDYGGYYAWGETRTKSRYNWSNCFDCVNTWKSSDAGWRKYKIGGQIRITPTCGRDTARENWGGTWRMPTDTECEELCRMCKWTLTGKKGHFGYTVTGPNGNSIYLPAAGWHSDLGMECVGERGCYWSCTLDSTNSNCARGMYFTEISEFGTTRPYRFEGLSVRPVTE